MHSFWYYDISSNFKFRLKSCPGNETRVKAILNKIRSYYAKQH